MKNVFWGFDGTVTSFIYELSIDLHIVYYQIG